MTPSLLASLLAVAAPILPGSLSLSQEPAIEFPEASPAATWKQRVGLTDVEVQYARPGAKGRKVFGGLVPYGEVWRTGANTSTTITFSRDVKVEGQAVPAGAYALFSIPGEAEWTVILSKTTGAWGAYSYDAKNDLARVKVKPIALKDPVETMTLELDELRGVSARFSILWEKTRVPVRIETDLVAQLVPQIEAAMAGAGQKPYFAAAMFYYENDLDLKKALAWMDEALKAQPGAVWMVYRKGLVQAKAGDKKGALASGEEALALAKKAGGALGDEYTHLAEALIASVK